MRVTVKASSVRGSVHAPPSKSYTHRAILAGSLSDESRVLHPLISADTQATINACEAIGAEIEKSEDELLIRGVGGVPRVPDNVVDCLNSGTTLRLMAGVGALVDGSIVLTGDDSLRKRPNTPLLVALETLGAHAFSTKGDGTAPIVVTGPLQGGYVEIPGSVSSQFISSLLFAGSLTSEGIQIGVQGELKSKPYIDITLDVLSAAGVRAVETKDGFSVDGGQEYHLGEYVVPGDFSSASYLLAAGAVCGEVSVSGLYPSCQGDSAIIDILSDMGAHIEWDKEDGLVICQGGDLRGVTVDVGETPDLLPTIAVLGAVADGETRIVNAAHVRYKETDRVHAMAIELSKMGVDVEELPDGLIIHGGRLRGARVSGHHDHRIVMALAIAGLAAEGTTVVEGAESVDISYPGFFDHLFDISANLGVER